MVNINKLWKRNVDFFPAHIPIDFAPMLTGVEKNFRKLMLRNQLI
jgi:hypothetical protein